MAEIEHLPSDSQVSDIVDVLEQHGAAIVDGLVSDEWLKQFNSEIQTSVDKYEPYDSGGRDSAEFMGYKTVRIGGLISKAPCSDAYQRFPFTRRYESCSEAKLRPIST